MLLPLIMAEASKIDFFYVDLIRVSLQALWGFRIVQKKAKLWKIFLLTFQEPEGRAR
jgi:hypothetical protein